MSFTTPDGIAATPPRDQGYADIVSIDALRFVADLHRRFEPRRQALLAARRERDRAAEVDALHEAGPHDLRERGVFSD